MRGFFRFLSEQTGDIAVFVNVDVLCSGLLGKSGHGHDIAREGNDEACTCGYLDVSDGYGEALGSAELCSVVREAVLRLCNADGKLAVAERLKLTNLLDCV